MTAKEGQDVIHRFVRHLGYMMEKCLMGDDTVSTPDGSHSDVGSGGGGIYCITGIFWKNKKGETITKIN